MQSLFRFLLAWLVVCAHLSKGLDYTKNFGVFAVFGFFLLSGYLMTLILNQTYDFRLVPYAVNRFLRLYPIYYIACAITIVLFVVFPGEEYFNWAWRVELLGWPDVIGNALIFPFQFYKPDYRLVPPTGSIAVEIVCYFMTWLVVARHRYIALACLAGSIAWHYYLYSSGIFWAARYAGWEAALLPFSFGAVIYFYHGAIRRLSGRTAAVALGLLAAAFAANLVVCSMTGALTSPYFNRFYYGNLLLLGGLVLLFAHPKFNNRATGIYKKIGDLAYPVFIIHWQAAFFTSQFIPDAWKTGWTFVAVSAPMILLWAYLIDIAAAKIFEPIRDRVRPKDAPMTEAAKRTAPLQDLAEHR